MSRQASFASGGFDSARIKIPLSLRQVGGVDARVSILQEHIGELQLLMGSGGG